MGELISSRDLDKDLSMIGLSRAQINRSLDTSRNYGVSGKVAFVTSDKLGKVAVKKGHSKEAYNAIPEHSALIIVSSIAPNICPIPYYVNEEENFIITEMIDGKSPKTIDELVVGRIAEKMSQMV